MGKTFSTGLLTNGLWQDASNNVGIGGSPSGSYKLEVTGTAKVSTSAYFAIASGSVGIGTITPTSYFYSGNGLAIYNASQNTLSIATDTSGTSSLFFSNGASGAARYNGYLEYIHSTNSMTFGTGGFTRLSLASTGNALFTGQIKTSFAGQSISVDGGSTASVRMQLQNTSGNAGVTVESSTGGDQFSGTSAYSMAIGTYTDKNFHIGTNSVARMTVSANGYVSIGKTSSQSKALELYQATDAALRIQNSTTGTGNTDGFLIECGGLDVLLYNYEVGSIRLGTNQTDRLVITSGGYIVTSAVTYGNTTGAAANMYLFGVGDYGIGRSVSSAKYKTQVEDVEKNYVDNIYKMRPIWYRSLCERDRKDWSHFGFIAEEMAEIEPRFVHWNKDEDGNDIAEGVQYDRITALLVAAVQELNQQNQDLKSRLDKAGL